MGTFILQRAYNHEIVISFTEKVFQILNSSVIMVSDAFFNIIMLTLGLGRYL